jgi:general stress protein YciG
MDSNNNTNETKVSKPKGFAAMTDKSRLREIAQMGGRAAHLAGTAHEFTSSEGAAAGRLGGRKMQDNRRAAIAKQQNNNGDV